MPAQWQKVEVPLTGALDEKAKPEAMPNGSLTAQLNAVQARVGAKGKRRGHVALGQSITGGGSIAAGAALFGFRDAVCMSDGAAIYSYSPTDASWRKSSQSQGCGLTRTQVAGMTSTPTWTDAVYCNGYYVVFYAQNGLGASPFYAVIDVATGVRVSVAPAVGTSSTDPTISGIGGTTNVGRICAVGNTVVFVMWDAAAPAQLKWSKLDCSSAATIAAGPPAFVQLGGTSDVNTNAAGIGVFDLYSTSVGFYTAYVSTVAPPTSILVRKWDTSGAQLTNYGGINSGAVTRPNAIGVYADENDRCWVAWNAAGGTQVTVIGLSPTNLSNVLSTQANCITTAVSSWTIGVVGLGGGAGQVIAWDPSNGQTYWNQFITSAGAVSPVIIPGGAWKVAKYRPHCRQIVVGGRIYVSLYTENPSNSGQVTVVDITGASTDAQFAPRPVANCAPGLIGATTRLGASGTGADEGIGLTHWAVASATNISLHELVNKSSQVASLDMFTCDFAAPRFQQAQVGEAVLLSGGTPMAFDGRQFYEVGFVDTPTIAAAVAAGVGGMSTTSTYTYQCIYEWVDATGCVHWSAPSATSSTVTPTAGNTFATVTVQALGITARLGSGTAGTGGTRVAIYRKKDATQFQRVGVAIVTGVSATFTDSMNDATASTQPFLYTEQGGLPRFRPPSFSIVCAHQDRIFGLDETGKNVWFSGQYVYGEAPWFSPLFQFPVDLGGPVTGFASMQGVFYIFKRDRIFYITGDGPADNGAGLYSLPAQIPTQVGCIEPRSVVTTSIGIFFQSDQGIYLLDRSNTVQFIGSGIEQTMLTTAPTITSAVLNEAMGRVYFTAAEGLRYEFDLLRAQWTVSLMGGFQAYVSAALVGGTISGKPTWCGLTSGGVVHQENAATFLDFGGWQTTILTTGWLKLDGEQAYSRVRNVALLAEQVTACDISISVYYNYATAPTDVRSFTAAEIATILSTSGTPMAQLGVGFSRQKIESFKISIQDATPTGGPAVGTGQGMNFLGLAFEVAPKSGTFRLPAINAK